MQIRRRTALSAALASLAGLTAACGDPIGIIQTLPPGVAVASGVVQDDGGRPGRGVHVYVGVVVGGGTSGAPCGRVGSGLLSLALTRTDANGRYRASVPAVEEGGTPPSGQQCVAVLAESRDTTAAVGEPARAFASPVLVAVPASAQTEVGGTLRLEPAGGDFSREPDDEWARLARTTVPGFAGFMFETDGRTLVAFVTDPATQAAAARQYVCSRVPTGCSGGASQVVVRRADYDFAQLRRWYDRAQVLTFLDGWRSTDIDESRNRLVLGYANAAARQRAARALATIDVPAGAVLLELEGDVVPAR